MRWRALGGRTTTAELLSRAAGIDREVDDLGGAPAAATRQGERLLRPAVEVAGMALERLRVAPLGVAGDDARRRRVGRALGVRVRGVQMNTGRADQVADRGLRGRIVRAHAHLRADGLRTGG